MYRESWVEINLDALKFNFNKIKEKSNKDLICVIKANGYGSGDQHIIQTALACGINFFAVSSLDEAIVLRNEGCREKILILGYVNPTDIKICIENKISCTVVSLDWLKDVCRQDTSGLELHLKVDTGMNRIGMKTLEECLEAINLCQMNNIDACGIFTHFACSDVANQEMTKKQYEKFKTIVLNLPHQFKYIHCDNSDALVSFQDNLTNYGRLGISMYGISTYMNDLKPVFSLYSTIACIKEVDAGETISYGATYTTSSKEIIATLPIGYADGWLRKNQGRNVYVDGDFAPIVGRVCMDQCMIRLKEFKPVGTHVELFGSHMPVQEVARDLETIPYEILTNLSERLTRVYIENGEILTEINARLERSKI
ncbi:alanine racemase [Anaerorhabdus sp.]|uniref:alanine racemase n=1 Tax=Anaerorhabdus sp. TaxID=1872524 RepID=UPI002FCC6090